MQKIKPCLWFDDRAEEAIEFYTSIFPNSKVTDSTRYGDAGPGTPGALMTANFELAGQEFMVLNGGPQFKFTEAISLFLNCETQQEVDKYWDALIAGGQPVQCGWLKDKYGLSWQIVPDVLGKYVGGPDPEGAQRAMQAMRQMVKIDADTLEKAYNG